jgi:hypothetical protein
MSDLYETDVLLWSEEQADLLRRLAAGERVNDQIDWDNLIEEVEDVGRSELHTVESLLAQALRHILKANGWPEHRDAPSWRADAIDFRGQAQARFAPSMERRIDLAKIYRRALHATPKTIDGQPPRPLPDQCPFTHEQLLSEDEP